MTKQEILDDMIEKHTMYVEDWQNDNKWLAYCDAWAKWREVRGD